MMNVEREREREREKERERERKKEVRMITYYIIHF